jgi:uncharacterized protein with PIN domain
MVMDPSILLAILKVEPEPPALIALLSQAGPKWISTATYWKRAWCRKPDRRGQPRTNTSALTYGHR